MQRLLRVRRLDGGRLAREDLGAVRCVPLIGAEGRVDPDAPSELS
jgi:hypothetical protein